jgi:hypothetical protein
MGEGTVNLLPNSWLHPTKFQVYRVPSTTSRERRFRVRVQKSNRFLLSVGILGTFVQRSTGRKTTQRHHQNLPRVEELRRYESTFVRKYERKVRKYESTFEGTVLYSTSTRTRTVGVSDSGLRSRSGNQISRAKSTKFVCAFCLNRQNVTFRARPRAVGAAIDLKLRRDGVQHVGNALTKFRDFRRSGRRIKKSSSGSTFVVLYVSAI